MTLVLGASLAVLLASLGLGRPELSDADECRSGVLVRALLEGQSVFALRTPDGYLCEKPPLYYLLSAAAVAGVQPDEAGLRAVSVLFGLGLLFVTGFLASLYAGPGAAWPAAAVLAANPLFLRGLREALPDMTLSFFCAAAWACWRAARAGILQAWPAALLGGFASGLATLAKGPLGLLLPGLAVAGELLREAWRSRRRPPPRAAMPLAVAGILALGLPLLWYLPAAILNGREFLETSVLEENFRMPLGRPQGIGVSHRKPWLYYPGLQLGALWPALFILPALARAFSDPTWRRAGRDALFFGGLGFLLFELAANKRAHYLLPIQPAGALLVGLAAARAERPSRPSDRAFAALFGLLASAAGLAALAAAVRPAEILPSELREALFPHRLPLALSSLVALAAGAAALSASLHPHYGIVPLIAAAAFLGAGVTGTLRTSLQAGRNRTARFVREASARLPAGAVPLLVGPVHGYALDYYWPRGFRRSAPGEEWPPYLLIRRSALGRISQPFETLAVWDGRSPDRDVLLIRRTDPLRR